MPHGASPGLLDPAAQSISTTTPRALAVALVTVAAFLDLVAYSIAVPILPDLSRRLGASPTTIGLLFSSFGVSLLIVSIPMGAISDRVGRKFLMVVGLLALSASSILFAVANQLPWLFAARTVQGGADAVTWVVGFALIADLYGPKERGRVMGLVMSGTTFGLMVGPSIGGWLYERGGPGLPFFSVAGLSGLTALAFVTLRLPAEHADRETVSARRVVREPKILLCGVVVVVAASTVAMLEPVLALWLASSIRLTPSRIGLVFGAAAAVATGLHPLYGRLADRFGSRLVTLIGLMLMALTLPVLSRAWSFESAVLLYVIQGAAIALVVTPSLAYMAESTSNAGVGSFGVAYGIYNVAWGAGLMVGPAVGGFLYEQMGFERLTLVWMPVVVLIGIILFRRKV